MSTSMPSAGQTLRRASDRGMDASMLVPGAARDEKFNRSERTIYINNLADAPAHGVEIRIEGLSINDVYRAYYLNRYGVPGISCIAGGIIVKFESLWGGRLREIYQRCSRPAEARGNYCWDILLYGGGNSERCGLELSSMNIKATYRWLLQADSTDAAADASAYVWAPHAGQNR